MTLSAAYAEAGKFSDAVHEQERAIDMLEAEDRMDDIADYASRLILYRQNKPYRLEPL